MCIPFVVSEGSLLATDPVANTCWCSWPNWYSRPCWCSIPCCSPKPPVCGLSLPVGVRVWLCLCKKFSYVSSVRRQKDHATCALPESEWLFEPSLLLQSIFSCFASSSSSCCCWNLRFLWISSSQAGWGWVRGARQGRWGGGHVGGGGGGFEGGPGGNEITTATSGASDPDTGCLFDLVRRQRMKRSKRTRKTVSVPNAAPSKVSSWDLSSAV